MPTYEYHCPDCNHHFELFQQMSDPIKRKCPECSGRKLKRLIGTGAGVIFKGSGFYETDYRSESYKKDAAAETKTKDDKPAKTDGGSKKKDADAKSNGSSSSKSEGKKTGSSE